MFEYKLLPVPNPSKKAKGRKTTSERFAHALAEVLNEQAKESWEFNGQECFSLEEKSGLMGKDKHLDCRYLIFRRKVQLDAMPLDQKLEKLRKRKSETMVQAAPRPQPAPAPEPFPEPMASPTPFPEPMPSRPLLSEPEMSDGEEPTRIFSPFADDLSESSAPALGPAEKPN